ncbi:MAG TPA: LacI family DNA-binding transcriptional regulator [Fervidobacterium sp.]|nr:LacI family transcriptional regulator [Fervidobacterium sp.]HOK87331.1 LacI family DNA-binding transcriptional regulator [Fervidobacterium sp.]HOM73531.1 LacI family DNA-binding transcriptional regulator [Fervidobacterium sp.]HPP17419.1 LacI family DNA-binding transcriptional regulator [Fervidobacterium sp.]HPZ17343.1 LacI family DNA-binding transcriptional regulator [Fervidobacterium sp.]
MKKFVTIRDVAATAGVSINTVSRALNDKPDINEETKKRVLRVAKELGYVRDATALSLRYGLTRVVGVIFEDSSNPFFSEVFKGIEMKARENGFSVILMNTEKDYNVEEEAIRTMISRRVDGIIITPTQEMSQDIEFLANISIPSVILGVHFDKLKLPEVHTDDVTGGFLATDYLIKKGRKRILLLNGLSYKSVARMRFEGYKKALKNNGIEFTDELVYEISEGVESAYSKTKELLLSGLDFDGMFCFNDIFAIGAIQALKEYGERIPQDISVVGYDDISYAKYISPALTTIAIDKILEGQTAFELLLESIEAKAKVPAREIVLDVKLTERRSA